MEALVYTAEAPFEAARFGPMGWSGHSFRLRVRAGPGGGAEDADALLDACRRAVAGLDGTLLNERLTAVDDAALVAELGQRLRSHGVEPGRVALRSAPERGAGEQQDADGQAARWSWRAFRFEAAHRLPYVPEGHPCARMHGHGYRVLVESRLADTEQLGAWWSPLGAALEHSCLNDRLENPTSEHLAAWIWAQLAERGCGVERVHVLETEHSGCTFDGRQHTAWKAQRFEAATAQAGAGDARARLHGHGYRLRVHVAAPLDDERGWTMDYGDIKAACRPVLEALDHQRLDRIAGLEAGDVGSLAQWIADALAERMPALRRVDVHEREGVGAIATPSGR